MPVLELAAAVAPPHPSPPVPPDSEHALALIVLQDATTDCPVCTEVGVMLKVPITAAAGALSTSTVTELGTPAPPAPVQVNVYV